MNLRSLISTITATSLSIVSIFFAPTVVAPQTIITPGATSQSDATLLEPGRPIERRLAGGESHFYQLLLGADQYLHVVVDQRGIDVVVALFGPDGKKLIEVDSPNGTQGPEPIYYVTEVAGVYRLEVRSLEKEAAPGKYEAKLNEIRPAAQKDRSAVLAHKLFAEAELLRAQGTAESTQQAISKYEETLPRWREAEDRQGEANTLHSIGDVYNSLGETLDQKHKALDYYNKALTLRRAITDRGGEAVTLFEIGLVYRQLGDWQTSLNYYSEAIPLARTVGDLHTEAYALSSMGGIYTLLGAEQRALDSHNQSLALMRTMNDQYGEAYVLADIGHLYNFSGEKQKALDYYNQSLLLRHKVGDRSGEAVTLTALGNLYDSLGERTKGLSYYNQALQLVRAVGDHTGEATVLNNIGEIHIRLEQGQEALNSLNQALSLMVILGNRTGQAVALGNMGSAYDMLGQRQKALLYYNQALPLNAAVGDRDGEATTLNNLGRLERLLGDKVIALDFLNRALVIRRSIGDRNGEAQTLALVAQVERDSGKLSEALAHMGTVLSIVEGLRTKITSQELRTSYLSTVQQYYELYIELLMQMHQQKPTEGFNSAALQACERGRARSLIELLNEAHADIRQGIDPKLLERERSVQHLLNSKTEEQIRLLVGKHTDEQATTAAKEVEVLKTEYQQVETEIKAKSPRYAALTQPQPLKTEEIQRLLDRDALLLEYSLGEDRSYLWAVTPSSIASYELPKRADVETAAKQFYVALTTPNQQSRNADGSRQLSIANAQEPLVIETASILSRMLLKPVASQLKKKRLIIVADGALQYIPFAALPSPDAQKLIARGQGSWNIAPTKFLPLIAEHEIVSLPSASTLAEIRRETENRKPAEKMVAVLADPVFDKNDERVTSAKNVKKADDQREEPSLARQLETDKTKKAAVETGLVEDGLTIPRLPGTRQEAEKILGFAPANARMKAFDFDASRATVTSTELAQYRYVQFATHGFLNSANPELSGIVLSMVDHQGQPQSGFLLTDEVFNLHLPAELVVLSACQTGLGKDIKGEGVVGLTRAFMYAGAPRVIMSLWSVNDKATSEMMSRLYRVLLQQHQRPAAALREAQLEMWKQKRWRAPYYWAAFELEGEWR